MKNISAFALVVGATMACYGGVVSAQPMLKDVPHVREGIIALGMAFEVSKKCNSISPRRIRGIRYLFSLRNHAYELGFSNMQVDAYVNDKAEENRLKDIAYKRLRDLGAITGNDASYCTLGLVEIAKDNAIGRLIR